MEVSLGTFPVVIFMVLLFPSVVEYDIEAPTTKPALGHPILQPSSLEILFCFHVWHLLSIENRTCGCCGL
jgi:hypothetical protein